SVHRRSLRSFPTRRSSDLSPVGTPGALVAQRDWDDYSIGRSGTQQHLGALDVVYAGIIEAHRRAIDATEELDPVTQDLLIEQARSEEHTSELQSLAYLVCR